MRPILVDDVHRERVFERWHNLHINLVPLSSVLDTTFPEGEHRAHCAIFTAGLHSCLESAILELFMRLYRTTVVRLCHGYLREGHY